MGDLYRHHLVVRGSWNIVQMFLQCMFLFGKLFVRFTVFFLCAQQTVSLVIHFSPALQGGLEALVLCAEDRLLPSCKIRLGTNNETSRVSTGKFTVTRHKNRSCKYMEDTYCDNDYTNMTPTRYSVLITSESGDELISLREQFIGRAEQHLLQHVPQVKFGW